ncbi:hypothetical protein PR003_g2976 [Phytophthora rubi]|uniref:Uncharacterized protein n=1 Tax=Phytophthora rubi TaxID=129364 RepID=A0A6A4G7W2_9STRA|nr:hypothetical protein PR001_g2838 [Phytophthora rubi]KAE9355160.1 hypothetical protein PR003_g2976 [Phytophthora rubi]
MELELSRRCRRIVRVAEFVTVGAAALSGSSAVRTGNGSGAASVAGDRTPLFAGYVEVLHARNAWLAVRVDIWTSRDTCFRQVKAASAYLHESLNDVALGVPTGEAMNKLQQVKPLRINVSSRGDELPALTGDELTATLEEVVTQLIDAFQEMQVQALQAATSQRAKFEYEILQHHPDLEVLVLTSSRTVSYALFALPLLGEKSQWDPKKLLDAEDPELVFLSDGFQAPNFSAATDALTIFIGYPLKDEEEMKLDGAWPLFVEWPARMMLSSQVTQTPPSSKAQSSVELIASCKEMFLQQWRRRKDFIAELRRHVIVLEYDAVDFSQVFFMLQEQLDAQSPLRIIVLRLQFSAAFFLTNCMSDLQLTLLDGEGAADSVVVALGVSSPLPSPDAAADSKAGVAQFLESTRKSLLRHFYGE